MQMQAAVDIFPGNPEQIRVSGIPRGEPVMVGIQRNDGIAKRIGNL